MQVDDEQNIEFFGKSPAERKRSRRNRQPPRTSFEETLELCRHALNNDQAIRISYINRDGIRQLLRIKPERIAQTASGETVLVGTDLAANNRLSYLINNISRCEIRS